MCHAITILPTSRNRVLRCLWVSGCILLLAESLVASSIDAKENDTWRIEQRCGVNSVYLYLQLSGTQVSYEDVRRDLPTDEQGSSLKELQQYLVRRNHSDMVVARGGAPLLASSNKPMIAMLEREPAKPSDGATSNHFVVVLNSDRETVTYVDGSTAAIHRMPTSQFLMEWTGLAIISQKRSWMFPIAASLLAMATALAFFRTSWFPKRKTIATTVGLLSLALTWTLAHNAVLGADPPIADVVAQYSKGVQKLPEFSIEYFKYVIPHGGKGDSPNELKEQVDSHVFFAVSGEKRALKETRYDNQGTGDEKDKAPTVSDRRFNGRVYKSILNNNIGEIHSRESAKKIPASRFTCGFLSSLGVDVSDPLADDDSEQMMRQCYLAYLMVDPNARVARDSEDRLVISGTYSMLGSKIDFVATFESTAPYRILSDRRHVHSKWVTLTEFQDYKSVHADVELPRRIKSTSWDDKGEIEYQSEYRLDSFSPTVDESVFDTEFPARSMITDFKGTHEKGGDVVHQPKVLYAHADGALLDKTIKEIREQTRWRSIVFTFSALTALVIGLVAFRLFFVKKSTS